MEYWQGKGGTGDGTIWSDTEGLIPVASHWPQAHNKLDHNVAKKQGLIHKVMG